MHQPHQSFTVNVRIVPFGHAVVQMGGGERREEAPETRPSVYTEPKTTNPHIIEIRFRGHDYGVPKTTGGFF
jgi:hypothetical protein